MSVKTTHSSAVFRSDGVQQIYAFVDPDGNPIPLEKPEDLLVLVDTHELKFRSDYMVSTDDAKALITLFNAPPNGCEISIERVTRLEQLLEFRRSGDWTVDGVEKGMDRIIMAVQDTIRRVAAVEKVIQIENRIVEVPLEERAEAGDRELILAIKQEMNEIQSGLSDADRDQLAQIIATVVVTELREITNPLAIRISELENRMHQIGKVGSEAA